MKSVVFFLSLLCVLMTCCAEKIDNKTLTSSAPIDIRIEIPNTTVLLSTLHYDNKTSLWSSNNQLYSGLAVSYYEDGVLKEKISFSKGRKQNEATQWFPDGHLKRISNYHKGKLHGLKKSWSPEEDHVLIAHLNYLMGKAHGKQTFWYSTGELYKKLTLKMGKEEGLQQAFRKNGALYANYEAKEGRIFGLKKATLCYGLENENIAYEK